MNHDHISVQVEVTRSFVGPPAQEKKSPLPSPETLTLGRWSRLLRFVSNCSLCTPPHGAPMCMSTPKHCSKQSSRLATKLVLGINGVAEPLFRRTLGCCWTAPSTAASGYAGLKGLRLKEHFAPLPGVPMTGSSRPRIPCRPKIFSVRSAPSGLLATRSLSLLPRLRSLCTRIRRMNPEFCGNRSTWRPVVVCRPADLQAPGGLTSRSSMADLLFALLQADFMEVTRGKPYVRAEHLLEDPISRLAYILYGKARPIAPTWADDSVILSKRVLSRRASC